MKKIITLLVLLFCLNANAQLCFNVDTNYVTNSYHNAITCADFNGDSKLDVAVTDNGSTTNITVYLGNGNGSFQTPTNYTAGSSPVAIANADFNGDSKLDLAVLNLSASNFSILLGTGTGNFSTATNYSLGTGAVPISVTATDFNNDSKIDLAIALTSTASVGNISVLLGNGLGGFGTVTNYSVGSDPLSVVSGDFNGDGKPDIASANAFSSNVSVILGNGLGSFGSATNYPVSTYPSAIIAADFNNDTKLDFATTGYNAHSMSILLNNGSGGFGNVVNYNTIGVNPNFITTGDFNGDLIPDIATSNYNGNSLSVFLGAGLGAFNSADTFAMLRPLGLVSRDFNGDNKTDIVIAHNNQRGLWSLLNCSTAGINQITNIDNQLNIYPNPTSTNFVIETSSTDKQTLQMFDVNGKLVLTQSINGKTNIDASHLAEGVYNLSLQNANGVVNKRLVIVR